MSQHMGNCFEMILAAFDDTDDTIKRSYSFESETDGFLPFGSEFARVEGNPDLCERFCYWRAHAQAREEHPFSRSVLVRAVAAYEEEIHALSRTLIASLCEEFGLPPLPPTGASSYVQLCAYGESLPKPGRQYAQDPHEDGHLLTFIRPSRDGLVLLRGRSPEPVRLLEKEVAVLAGSLLTRLSDYAILAAYHAVLAPARPMKRKSLIYFVNPDPRHQFVGFHTGRPVDLAGAMNERHTDFGNHPIPV